jgi:CHASE3 domain sensor protein
MPWIPRLSSTATFVSAIAAAGVIMLFAGWSIYDANRDATQAARWVNHSQEVLRALSVFRESFASISAGQRGYLLTGSAQFVAGATRRSRAPSPRCCSCSC